MTPLCGDGVVQIAAIKSEQGGVEQDPISGLREQGVFAGSRCLPIMRDECIEYIIDRWTIGIAAVLEGNAI